MREEAKHLKQAKEILPKGSIIVFPSFVFSGYSWSDLEYQTSTTIVTKTLFQRRTS